MDDYNGLSIPTVDPSLWLYLRTTWHSDDPTKVRQITFCVCDRPSRAYPGADGLPRCNVCHFPASLAPPP